MTRGRHWAGIAAIVFAATGATGCKKLFDSGDDFDAGGFGGRGVGSMCANTDDCRAGLRCTMSVCQPSRSGVEGAICSLSGDCAEGLYCGARRVCEASGDAGVGERCDYTSNCESGLVCAIQGFFAACVPSGTRDLGQPCASDLECLAGLSCGINPSDGARVCVNPPPLPAGDGGVPQVPPTIPFWPGETCAMDTTGAEAYFDVPRTGVTRDFYRLPYPNDIRRTATGLDLSGHPHPGTVLAIDIIDRYLRMSEQDLDGFALNPIVYFRFSKEYDWDSIGGRIELVDITPESPTYGQATGLFWLTTSGAITKYICPNWLAMRTPHGSPLRPGTTYAALVRTGVTTSTDVAFSRAPDFDAMLAATSPTDPALAGAYAKYAPLRAYLDDKDIAPSALLNAAVFTTQDPEREARALRDAVRALDAPTIQDLTLCDTGVTSPCDDGSEQRRCGAANPDFYELHGRIALPIFQQGTPPYLSPDDGGDIRFDSSGVPMVARTENVCFAMTIPKDAPTPANGFPIVIYAHGTGGSFTNAARNVANDVSRGMLGMESVRAATLAIDMPQHGARRGTSTEDPEPLFYNFLNPRAARDNILQGSADLISLVDFAESFSLPAAMSPTTGDIAFNPERIVLYTHSQGSTHGSLVLPYEPAIRAIVLSGQGGDLLQSLLNKTEPIDIKAAVPFALLDVELPAGTLAGGEFHPALAIFQQYFERVDPVNFGHRIHRAPIEGGNTGHVFMTYGLGDTYSPEATMQAFALASGFTLVRPELVGFGLGAADAPLHSNVMTASTPRTIALRQYTPPSGVDGHFVASRSDQGHADTTRFLLQSLNGDVPRVGASE